MQRSQQKDRSRVYIYMRHSGWHRNYAVHEKGALDKVSQYIYIDERRAAGYL